MEKHEFVLTMPWREAQRVGRSRVQDAMVSACVDAARMWIAEEELEIKLGPIVVRHSPVPEIGITVEVPVGRYDGEEWTWSGRYEDLFQRLLDVRSGVLRANMPALVGDGILFLPDRG